MEFAVVVVIESWVTLHTFLLAQLMVLAFGAVHRSIGDLKDGGNGQRWQILSLPTFSLQQ